MTPKRENKITIRLSDKEKELIEELANLNRVSVSKFIRTMLFSYINLCREDKSPNFIEKDQKIQEIKSDLEKAMKKVNSLEAELLRDMIRNVDMDTRNSAKSHN